ncbi:3-dehydroquinate synthase [Alkalibacillus aidingensis]|uniref:3-dehydroquinate synthase n=1 Tax=Alkalibacillus aidingensis TaxID=2747607 RepID=UPI0016617BC6|nr:3-dehydroquinate synthase [Alkalibacillus aidingensis]
MKKIEVKSIRNYWIYIDQGIRKRAWDYIKPFSFNQIAIITDENVANYYLNDLVEELSPHVTVKSYILPSGEWIKSLNYFQDLQEFLLKHYFDRNSAVIALGGGVIGDLAGFVASTYMRGIGFIQMPTTLLAHDSSVGGKVAINLEGTKNIIGQFYTPHIVLYDEETLETLTSKELRSGFAEVVKHGFISDPNLLKLLMDICSNSIEVKQLKSNDVLRTSIQVKKEIIEQDERELDIRRYLNFGHTLGHAIESVYSSYKPTHGECVMIGMIFALYISDQLNDQKLYNPRFLQWITRLGYRVDLSKWDISRLVDQMLNDKKNYEQKVHFVLLEGLSKPYVKSFDAEDVHQLLDQFIKELKQHKFIKTLF